MWHACGDVERSGCVMKYSYFVYCTCCTEAYLTSLHDLIAESHAALTKGQASDLL